MREKTNIYPSSNRKMEFKSLESIRPIRKINQSADALAAFENSNEIQKLDDYPAQELEKT